VLVGLGCLVVVGRGGSGVEGSSVGSGSLVGAVVGSSVGIGSSVGVLIGSSVGEEVGPGSTVAVGEGSSGVGGSSVGAAVAVARGGLLVGVAATGVGVGKPVESQPQTAAASARSRATVTNRRVEGGNLSIGAQGYHSCGYVVTEKPHVGARGGRRGARTPDLTDVNRAL
jgi:hypothetical protein